MLIEYCDGFAQIRQHERILRLDAQRAPAVAPGVIRVHENKVMQVDTVLDDFAGDVGQMLVVLFTDGRVRTVLKSLTVQVIEGLKLAFRRFVGDLSENVFINCVHGNQEIGDTGFE